MHELYYSYYEPKGDYIGNTNYNFTYTPEHFRQLKLFQDYLALAII